MEGIMNNNNAWPMVSAVIPVYNDEAFLYDAVESVVSQNDYRPEIIIVDDGSEDETPKIAERLRLRHATVRVHRQSNKGPANARNRGIALARGIYIGFLDSDDYWLPNKLSTQIDWMREQNIRAAITAVHVADNNLNIQYTQHKPYQSYRGKRLAKLFYDNKVGMNTPTLLADADVLRSINGFDESLKKREEHDLLIRLALSEALAVLNEPLTVRRERDSKLVEGTRGAIGNSVKDFFDVLEKHREVFGDPAYHEARQACAEIGIRGALLQGDRGEASYWSRMMTEHYPALRWWIYQLASKLPTKMIRTFHKVKRLLKTTFQ